MVTQKVLWKPLRPSLNLFSHCKEVWKWKFKLIFILMQLSEMLGAGRVNKVAGWCVELHWKETLAQAFSYECWKMLRTPFQQNTSGKLPPIVVSRLALATGYITVLGFCMRTEYLKSTLIYLSWKIYTTFLGFTFFLQF